MENAPETDE